jgi:hypothetical protein
MLINSMTSVTNKVQNADRCRSRPEKAAFIWQANMMAIMFSLPISQQKQPLERVLTAYSSGRFFDGDVLETYQK